MKKKNLIFLPNQKINNFSSLIKRGFTLIELLVVISIMGILAALIMANFNSARERARDAQRKSDLDQIKKALLMYYNDAYCSSSSCYPQSTSDNKICGCGNPCTSFEWGSRFACGEIIYMKPLPQDPLSEQTYKYLQKEGGQNFCLWATLENKSDGDIQKSKNRCAGCNVGTYDYVVCAD